MTAACGGSSDDSEREQPPDGGQGPGNGRSPFTGQTGKLGPVLAVKIDNAASARPHTGLQSADLVFVERVEGGGSRLMAVYSRRLPESTGPVRSARESDLELLRQFDRPALAYSGVRSALKDELRDAPLEQLSPTEAPEAFSRSGSRPAPHNLFVRPEAALKAAPDAGTPRDIGFRFGAAPSGGEPTTHRTVRYPASSFGFDWSAQDRRWLVSMDGTAARTTEGARLGAATVVVQEVTIRSSSFRDVAGAVTPYIETVGSGQATVLRDGKAYATEWKRPAEDSGTAYTLANGKRMTFARGPVWIVYTGK